MRKDKKNIFVNSKLYTYFVFVLCHSNKSEKKISKYQVLKIHVN